MMSGLQPGPSCGAESRPWLRPCQALRPHRVLWAAAILGIMAAQAARAAPAEQVVTVAHVDILPDRLEGFLPLLQTEAAASRNDDGCESVQVLQQAGLPNHVTVVTTWRNTAARAAHDGSLHTRSFRTMIQPLIGSPYDERVNTVAE